MINVQVLKLKIQQMKTQIKLSWKDALSAGIAAGLAWFFSAKILGHYHPIYAAMSALICLAPGLPSHGRQAMYVLQGVLTGVLVGEATLLLPAMPTEVRIALVGFAGLAIASSYALAPPLIIQAGVSAIMVFALGTDVAGWTRVVDVIVGVSIGLMFSQVLFTPDPLKKLRMSVERFFHELSNNFKLAAQALEKNNVSTAIVAMKSCGRTHMALIGLIAAIDVARNNARWTLRGRLASREVTSLSARYDQSGIRLYASSLLFSEALVNAIRKNREEPPEWLPDALISIAHNCRFLAGELKADEVFKIPNRSIRTDPPLSWRECVNDIELVENTLVRFYKSKTRKNRLSVFRKKQILDAVREEVKKHKKRNAENDPQQGVDEPLQ